MKTASIQQEIVLFTGTHFASLQAEPKDETPNKAPLNEAEQLEMACWNGMIPAMLPEICEHSADGSDLYLWDIKEGQQFITLDLAEFPVPKDRYFSIDPYNFLREQILS